MTVGVRRSPLQPTPPARSTAGRTIYAVGDIQGRYDLLVALLETIAEDMATLSASAMPLMIFCGGYADHGPDGPEVLGTLLWLLRNAPAETRVLQGPREQAFLNFIDRPDTLTTWLELGGGATLRAFGLDVPDSSARALCVTRDALTDRLPASQLALLRNGATSTSCGDYAFAAEIDRRIKGVLVHGSGDGSAAPQIDRNRIALDTAAHQTGVLTALRLEGRSAELLQTEQTLDPPIVTRSAPKSEAMTMREALERLSRPD